MKYFNRSPQNLEGFFDNNPLTGVANLFDLGLVFMVGLLVALFGAYHLDDLLSEKSNVTITKQSAEGTMEIIVKKGNKVDAMKVTRQETTGKGHRLGIAYKLADGSFIYVPDTE